MQIIKYYLLPESGYLPKEEDIREAHYIVKKGTIANMLHDSFILYGSEFDKVIPCYDQLNTILNRGEYGRSVEWNPIRITEEEYWEITNYLLNLDILRRYRVDSDK